MSAVGIRVLLVDDHELVRRGVAELLGGEPDLEVVAEAASIADALARAAVVEADVAVLDVRMPDGNGVELCRELRARHPGLRCLMLTSQADDGSMADALAAGASGVLLKRVLGLALADAIRTTGRGWLLPLDRDHR
jgi:DNA-binding NarL/FixJ family response regulator